MEMTRVTFWQRGVMHDCTMSNDAADELRKRYIDAINGNGPNDFTTTQPLGAITVFNLTKIENVMFRKVTA